MDALVILSLDLQLLLVGGFFAYKISVVGTQTEDATEELILKVIAFGLTGRLLHELLVLALDVWIDPALFRAPVAVGLGVIVACLLVGMVWRRWVGRLVARTLNRLRVHRDDHFQTTWDSIVNTPALWDFIQLHLTSGVVLESDFYLVQETVPLGKLTLNDDGIALYVTRIHRTTGAADMQAYIEGRGFVATFVPKEQIAQIDICWRGS